MVKSLQLIDTTPLLAASLNKTAISMNKEQSVDFSVWPKGQPNTAYAQYFTGNSYLAQMEGGLANVSFEPGCRNNWHIHHKQVQVLICEAGRSWYQEWGKAAVQLLPGTDEHYSSLPVWQRTASR